MKRQEIEIIRTTTWSAGPGCHGGCGVLAHVKDNKLVKLEGDPEHPWNQGRLCARALAMTQYVDNPERLRRPLKRIGARGEGKWREISWDEAYDLIEKEVKAIRDKYGPESMIFSMGTGRDIGPWICMLAYAYGSPWERRTWGTHKAFHVPNPQSSGGGEKPWPRTLNSAC
ncbi:MAG: molybdopterin-dependent oxidoreductase [Deltaproteobacteria bacterium]|nr:molybdopterin-dependent oxidoreductase [Deltaproteobacteria bacterium]